MSCKESEDKKSDPSGNKICRIVVQQCVEASLKFDTDDPAVSIGAGMVVFVCFLQGATSDRLNSIAKAIMNAKLCEPGLELLKTEGASCLENVKRKSVVDCNYDILVIPQATLGGKLKGAATQYHGLVSKELGHELFYGLVSLLKESSNSYAWKGKVENGVYGAKQILKMDTNGPFTHLFEF